MKPFTSEEDVITKANDTRYGLTATVWTEDVRKGLWFVDNLCAGRSTSIPRFTFRITLGRVQGSGFGKKATGWDTGLKLR
jgi:aminomuconate-semialdehyde/2-hydroxymuconate-6-semialdehyde dehydrogenase